MLIVSQENQELCVVLFHTFLVFSPRWLQPSALRPWSLKAENTPAALQFTRPPPPSPRLSDTATAKHPTYISTQNLTAPNPVSLTSSSNIVFRERRHGACAIENKKASTGLWDQSPGRYPGCPPAPRGSPVSQITAALEETAQLSSMK